MDLAEDMVKGHKAEGSVGFTGSLKVGHVVAGNIDVFMGQHDALGDAGGTAGIEDGRGIATVPIHGPE